MPEENEAVDTEGTDPVEEATEGSTESAPLEADSDEGDSEVSEGE